MGATSSVHRKKVHEVSKNQPETSRLTIDLHSDESTEECINVEELKFKFIHPKLNQLESISEDYVQTSAGYATLTSNMPVTPRADPLMIEELVAAAPGLVLVRRFKEEPQDANIAIAAKKTPTFDKAVKKLIVAQRFVTLTPFLPTEDSNHLPAPEKRTRELPERIANTIRNVDELNNANKVTESVVKLTNMIQDEQDEKLMIALLLKRADCYELLKEYELAMVDINAALEICDCSEALEKRSEVLLTMGKDAGALETLAHGLDLFPTDQNIVHAYQALQLQLRGKLDVSRGEINLRTGTPSPTSLGGGPSQRIFQSVYLAVDTKALSMEVDTSANESISSFVSRFMKMFSASETDLKVRALFRWITYNIAIDGEGYKTGSFPSQSATEVFQRKSANSSGFANLFEAFCKEARIDVQTISGFAKGSAYLPSDDIEVANHRWNMVRIENEWKLIDCCWASGYLQPNYKFVRRLNDGYFKPDPQQLSSTHFPINTSHQLLKTPISKEDFVSRVALEPAAMRSCITPMSHHNSVIRHDSNSLTIALTRTSAVQLTCSLKLNGVDQELRDGHTIGQKQPGSNRHEFQLKFLQQGTYTFSVFAKVESDKSTCYELALSYTIIIEWQHFPTPEADTTISAIAPFPTAFEMSNQMYLMKPLTGVLRSDQVTTFSLLCPAKQITLSVMNNGRVTNLHRSHEKPEVCEVSLKLQPGNVEIVASLQHSHYHYCYVYKVQ